MSGSAEQHYVENRDILKYPPYRTDQVPIVASDLREFLTPAVAKTINAWSACSCNWPTEHEAARLSIYAWYCGTNEHRLSDNIPS